MRAKRVFMSAVVFDFDETLIQSTAKIHIYKNNKRIRSLTSRELNFYKKKDGEEPNFDEFDDHRLLLSSTKYKMWSALENLYFKVLNGDEAADIFILTTRKPKMIASIYTYLKRNNIIIPEENILAIGEEGNNMDVAKKKKSALENLKKKYDSILFYDDNPDNIKLAGEINGINTILVDWN